MEEKIRSVKWQIAVYFIGRYLMITFHTILFGRIQKNLGSDAMGVINLVVTFVTAIVFAILLNEIKSRGGKKVVYISADCRQMQKRKKADRYSFFTENEMNVALYLFFSNQYNAKRIARSCYMLDEDTKFNESLDTGIPVGRIVLPNGGIMVSSVVEAVLKVRRYDERNEITGMPFDVAAFRIIS